MITKVFRIFASLLMASSFLFTEFRPVLAAPPANDNFADAEIIDALPFNTIVDNTDATLEPGEPQGCGFPFQSLWYSFSPAENMVIRVDMTGSQVGGIISIFVASGPTISDLTPLGCVSNNNSMNWQVEAEKTYYLRVDSFGQAGPLGINLQEIIPPSNDSFANAEVINSLPFTGTVDNTNATLEIDEPQACGFPFQSVWYAFTPTQTMALRVDLSGSVPGGVAGIFLASGSAISDLTFLNCAYTYTSANFQVQAGSTYYLRVDSYGQPGILQINMEQIFPPPNDNFANAEAILSLPFNITVNNTDATTESGENTDCASRFRSVWYSFTPTQNIAIRMDTLGSFVSGNASIYRASGSSISDLIFLTCAGGGSSTKVQLEVGTTYYLRVDSYGQGGTIQFNLVESIPPANDNFADAQAINTTPFSDTAEISDASIETSEPQPCGYIQNTVWYSFTATKTTTLRADTAGSSMFASVNVYHATGDGFAGLQSLQCSYFGGAAVFTADAGETYYFQVGGSGQMGTVQFNLAEMAVIKGRIIDAVTAAPLPGDMPPFATAHLYRVGENGLDFIKSQQADGEGQFSFDSDYYGNPLSVGSYQIIVTASLYTTKQFEPFQFNGSNLDVGDLPLSPPSVIQGRAVDSNTGNPLTGAYVTLRRCISEDCSQYVNSQSTDIDGHFEFNSFYYNEPLSAGTYEVEIAPTLYVKKHIRVTISDGENRDLGNVSVDPVALIGSISGRVVDAATGMPISIAFSPGLYLMRCEEGICFNMTPVTLNSDGRFYFESDVEGNHLTVGTYRIVAFAEQYEFAQTGDFEVGENQDLTVPDIKVNSKPVRFSQLQPCADIPATGGDCSFTITVTNGTTRDLTGNVWSLANGFLPESFAGYTNFQIKESQDLALAKGKSKVFRFRFNVPPNSGSYGTYMCTSIFVGERPQAFFNTLGSRDLFCVFWNGTGFAIASPQEVLSAQSESNILPNGMGLIGSISGVITDAVSGKALRGDVPPYTYVRLLRCEAYCFDVNSQFTGSDGRFSFQTDFYGNALPIGEYRIAVFAQQYYELQTDSFTVGEGQTYHTGNIALHSYPVRLADIQACNIPTEGGVCDFTVKITNGLPTKFSGKAWSVVDGDELGSFMGFTLFQTDLPMDISLDPGKSTLLRFRFQVPSFVANGATICPGIYVGQNPAPVFNTVWQGLAFCIIKGSNGFTLLSEQAMHSQVQQMLLHEATPANWPSLPKE